MSSFLSRRRFITTAVSASVAASAAGVAGFLAKRTGLIPPDHSGLFGIEKLSPMQPIAFSSLAGLWLGNSTEAKSRKISLRSIRPCPRTTITDAT